MKNRPEKRLYTLREAARYLGRTEWALRALINSGKLPTVRIDRKIQFDIFDLDEWIERHKSRFVL